MSVSSAEARMILDNLLEAKGVAREVRSEISRAQSDVTRLLSAVSSLQRGDVAGLIPLLVRLGPYGALLAATIFAGVFIYEVYKGLTAEKPSEYYYWRYPQ